MINESPDLHPCLKHHDIVKALCKPLEKLGVTFFGYTALDKQGSAYCLGSKTDYAEEYLRRHNVMKDLLYHGPESKDKFDYSFWDFQDLDEQKIEIYRMAREFDQAHTLSVGKHEENISHCFHFSGKVNDESLNQRLLSKMDNLHAFIDQFSEKLETLSELKAIYDHPSAVTKENIQQREILLVDGNPRALNFEEAEHTMKFKRAKQYFLTKQERECLRWLKKGKSAEMIADIKGLSRKTIERHIASLKEKFDCYTLFQLGEKIALAGLSEFLQE